MELVPCEKAAKEFLELCRQATETRKRQGVSVEEAGQILEEAIRAARFQETE
jgi:hypothetical protein